MNNRLKIYLILIVFLWGCSTVATQSEDRNTLKIRGSGKATFENGAKIEGGSYIPKLPKVEVD